MRTSRALSPNTTPLTRWSTRRNSDLEPMDDLALEAKRKERVRLKDEIFALLSR